MEKRQLFKPIDKDEIEEHAGRYDAIARAKEEKRLYDAKQLQKRLNDGQLQVA
jgi:hypothetical protein